MTTTTTTRSIASWAADCGSAAKTPAGQRRAILSAISAYTPPRRRSSDSHDWTLWRTQRIVRAADRRAEILGYPPVSAAWIDYVSAYNYNCELDRYQTEYLSAADTLAYALGRTYAATWHTTYDPIAITGTICARVQWDTESDWEAYGKRYGHPKNTFAGRCVDFFDFIDGKITTLYSVPCDSFRGEFLRSAILEAARELALPDVIEIVRAIPTRSQRIVEELATPKPCYKRVAVRASGELISIYDGSTIYRIGEVVSDRPTRCPDYDDICGYGGIFVHETRERAEAQSFPVRSAAGDLPRVTLRGEYWGKINKNGKIAAEFFRPLEIVG